MCSSPLFWKIIEVQNPLLPLRYMGRHDILQTEKLNDWPKPTQVCKLWVVSNADLSLKIKQEDKKINIDTILQNVANVLCSIL